MLYVLYAAGTRFWWENTYFVYLLANKLSDLNILYVKTLESALRFTTSCVRGA